MNLSSLCRALRRYLPALRRRWRIVSEQRRILAEDSPGAREVSRDCWEASLADPREFYERCFRYFHLALDPELRMHREYFVQEGRGFGEDAFHVMWWLLFEEFRPEGFLEIGVYRGQTLSLAALLAGRQGRRCDVVGISPFSNAGDSVSAYSAQVDYLQDTLANFRHFGLADPKLVTAYSTDQLARAVISGGSWGCIYVDGNHDYEVAKADWELSAASVCHGGLIVLDDSGLSTGYKPPLFATGGHPGPSRVAAEINRREFDEILQVGHNRVFQKRAA